jgi:hypothetical protein
MAEQRTVAHYIESNPTLQCKNNSMEISAAVAFATLIEAYVHEMMFSINIQVLN